MLTELGMKRKAGAFHYKLARMASFRNREFIASGLFRVASLLDPAHPGARREVGLRSRRRPGERTFLTEVVLGTTGQCNAACIHCPTNKDITGHVPRTPMAMPLFEKIIHGIADQGLAITGQIAFGLHGDGLLDPYVVERARIVREVLPEVPLGVNTNAAAFNPARHRALRDSVSCFTVHCESLRPQVYEELMAPLRLKNVLPKFRQMFEAFPGKVRVSVPVSRLNRDELPEIKAWFLAAGACDVIFDPLASRCVDDRSIFDRLALAPGRIRCSSVLLDYLVVDSDGTVLGCCQDFQRLEGIGNLATESFAETLRSLQRRRFGQRLDAGDHDNMATCSKCYGDVRTPEFPFDFQAA